jgi:hypothetical protein
MSLKAIGNLFYLMVITLAIILDCTAGMIGWAVAVVILIGARPVFHSVICATLKAVEDRSCAHASPAKTPEAETQGHDRRGTLPEALQ